MWNWLKETTVNFERALYLSRLATEVRDPEALREAALAAFEIDQPKAAPSSTDGGKLHPIAA